MKNELVETHVYRPLMAGVAAGFIATVLNMFYDIIYRNTTGFSLTSLINVSTILFITMLLLLAAGGVFALIDRYSRYPQITYIILFVLLTILCVWLSLHTHRSDDAVLTHQFRELLAGVVIISGACASFLIPYLSKNENIFI